MPYGILRTEPPPKSAVAELLEAAWHEGIRYFDTAEAYGDSEQLLSTHLPSRQFADARIITKLHPDASGETALEIERRLERSRARLGRRSLWGLLLHRDRMLDRWDDGLGEVLRRWRADGLIRHLGVSAESFQRLPALLAVDELDVIQLPANVFDRRAVDSGLWERARQAGKQVFLRSVYFQGMALADAGEMRARAPGAAEMVEAYARFCELHGLDRRRFAVDYVRNRLPGAVLVIGAETAQQVRENCGLVAAPACDPALCDAWDQEWRAPDESQVDLPRLSARFASRGA
jgi:aryl-alcohol dehydrogenase-like predicted oxidoreductase